MSKNIRILKEKKKEKKKRICEEEKMSSCVDVSREILYL